MVLKRFAGRRTHKKELAANRPRILYVEDEDFNFEIAAAKLEDKYILDRAQNAAEAFEQLRRNTYCAVFMDIELHGSELNGIEIAQVLRGMQPARSVSDAEAVQRAKSLDAIIFVT